MAMDDSADEVVDEQVDNAGSGLRLTVIMALAFGQMSAMMMMMMMLMVRVMLLMMRSMNLTTTI